MIFSKNYNQLNKTILYFSISTCFLSYDIWAEKVVRLPALSNPAMQESVVQKPLQSPAEPNPVERKELAVKAPNVDVVQEHSIHAGALITNVAPSVVSTDPKSASSKKDVEVHAEDMPQKGDVLTGIYVGSKFYAVRSSEEHYSTLQNLEENGITKGSIYYVFRRNGVEKKVKVKIEKVGANNFDGLSSSNFTVENALQRVQDLIYSRKPKEVSDEAVVVKNIFGLFLKSIQDETVYNFDALFYAQNYKLADDVIVNFASKIDSILALLEEKINASNVGIFLGYSEDTEALKEDPSKAKVKTSVAALTHTYQELVKTYNSLVKVEVDKINPLVGPSFESIDTALSAFSALGAKVVVLRASINRKSEPLYYTYRDAADIQKIITIDKAFLKLSVIVKSLDLLKKKVDASKASQVYQSERDVMVKKLNDQTQNDVAFLKDLKRHFESMRQSSLYGYCHTSLRPTGFLLRSLTPGTLAQQLDLRLNDIVKSVTVTSVHDKKQSLFLAGDILSKRFADKAQGLFKRGDQVSAEVIRLSSSQESVSEKVNIGPLGLTDDIPISNVGIDFYNWSENLCAIVHSGVTRFASQQRIGFETPQDYMNKRFSEIVSLLLDCLEHTKNQDFSKLAQSNCDIPKWNWNNGKIHVMANLLNILDALETVLVPPRVNSASLENGQIPSPIFVDADVQTGLSRLLNKEVDQSVVKRFIRLDELKEFLVTNWGAVSKILNNPQDFDKVKVDKVSMVTFRQSMVKLIAVNKIYSVLKNDKVADKGLPSEFDLYMGLDKILSTFPGQALAVKEEVKVVPQSSAEVANKALIVAESEVTKEKEIKPIQVSEDGSSDVEKLASKPVVQDAEKAVSGKVVATEDKVVADAVDKSSKPLASLESSEVQNKKNPDVKLEDEIVEKSQSSNSVESLKENKEKLLATKKDKDKEESVDSSSTDSFVPPFADDSFSNDTSSSEASEIDDLKKMKDTLNNQTDKLLKE
ncbi:MAG: hypothetical protein C0432_04065 [Candidatus Puniceispirillum sp.]|nr:hypothetical protein [Candidatus Pelagibacter sp.]MBA4283451.1 hypothetical protein [Candidatus Puniceispirillum sp.]